MRKFIELLIIQFDKHPHLETSLATLEYLVWLETNIEEISKTKRVETKKYPYRFCVSQKSTEYEVKNDILNFVNDVKSNVKTLTDIKDNFIQYQAINIFLNYLNKSDTIFIETRFIEALAFVAKIKRGNIQEILAQETITNPISQSRSDVSTSGSTVSNTSNFIFIAINSISNSLESIIKTTEDIRLVFNNEELAKSALSLFKHIFQEYYETFLKKIKENVITLTHQGYYLLNDNYNRHIVNLNPPIFSERAVIKTLRGNREYIFAKNFFQSATRSSKQQKKFDLRPGPRKKFTVTSRGVFERSKRRPFQSSATNSTKHLFSQQQSVTLVFKGHNPAPFRFKSDIKDKKNIVVGAAFDIKDIQARHLMTIDINTIARPYDFNAYRKAIEYHRSMKKNKIFASDFSELETFILHSHSGRHNEILARLRWNKDGTSQLFIGNDNFESRILIQTYANLLLRRLQDQALEDNEDWDENYKIPIYFYAPTKSYHCKPYNSLHQLQDQSLAKYIAENPFEAEKKFKAQKYEFLLALPTTLLREIVTPILMTRIISQGHLLIADTLLENLDKNFRNELPINTFFLEKNLFFAAKNNHHQIIGYLIKELPKNFIFNADKLTEIFTQAILNDQHESIEILLTTLVDKKALPSVTANAILICAYNGARLKTLDYLLKFGLNPFCNEPGINSLFALACQQNELSFVKLLLNNKTPYPNDRDEAIDRILKEAGHARFKPALLNFIINMPSKPVTHSLKGAVALRDQQLVDKLLNYHEKIFNYDGALHLAIELSYTGIAESILTYIANNHILNINSQQFQQARDLTYEKGPALLGKIFDRIQLEYFIINLNNNTQYGIKSYFFKSIYAKQTLAAQALYNVLYNDGDEKILTQYLDVLMKANNNLGKLCLKLPTVCELLNKFGKELNMENNPSISTSGSKNL